MSEIHYNELQNHISGLKTDAGQSAAQKPQTFAPVYLIFGDEYLYKTAFDALLDALLPGANRSLNFEQFDGANVNIFEVIEQLNTFSFMSGAKVVAVRDARIFYSKQNNEQLLDKARQAYRDEAFQKAANYFVGFLSLLNVSGDDLQAASFKDDIRRRLSGTDADHAFDDEWLDGLIRYVVENNLAIPPGRDDAQALQNAIAKGFPANNHLIITTDTVDKRRTLYQSIKKCGMIVDCSVPKGDRMADRRAQDAILTDKMKTVLAQSGKTISRSAYQTLVDMTGFDLRTFTADLEKLITYVADRKEITEEDIRFLLKRSRQDPIYELTGALSDRSTEKSLFFLNSLLSSGMYPLQTLAALINQIRKLLLMKDFAGSSLAAAWHKGMPFNQFKNDVLPAIAEYDNMMLKRLEEWDQALNGESETAAKSGKKKKPSTDLLIAKNPKNPYPVYQLLQKSENFTQEELLDAFEYLHRADLRLKTTGENPRIILEKAIIHICRGGKHVENKNHLHHRARQ